MITADKVFKGSTEIIRIYKGTTLEWEKAEDKYIKWEPTTFIDNDDAYVRLLKGRASSSVTLLIKGYTSIDITISYSANVNQEDHYVKAYKLDSTSSVQNEVNMDTDTSKTITYNIPDDGAEHSIYFTCYGGYYSAYTTTFRVSYSNAS